MLISLCSYFKDYRENIENGYCNSGVDKCRLGTRTVNTLNHGDGESGRQYLFPFMFGDGVSPKTTDTLKCATTQSRLLCQAERQ